jgi:glycosyltransferase involved in cell wall biosynthesis
MRIIIAANQVPFIYGGAQLLANGLQQALRQAGHEVETVSAPFKFYPESYIHQMIAFWLEQDFEKFNDYTVDKVIALQFPAYYVQHPNKVVWLLHQHRSVYELYDEKSATAGLRNRIHSLDSEKLAEVKKIFTIAKTVSARLQKFNRIDSIPLYHPPYRANAFYCASPLDYIFFPSRLESLKRQDLLIRAMQYLKTPVKAIIAGTGGQQSRYRQLIEELHLEDKVKLVGYMNEDEKHAYYARCFAVFFGPWEEDYGYVTLEAMLSSKPVITCSDSGGPLEFVTDGENGFIVPPEPNLIAAKIDWLYWHKNQASKFGKSGLEIYKSKNICWDNVVRALVGA